MAFLKLPSILESDIPRSIEQAHNARGLIVDIWSYPNEFVALGGRLVSAPTEFARSSRPDLANPGSFLQSPPLESLHN